MRDDEFEWHDETAEANLAQHGGSFVTARRAFSDPFAVCARIPARTTARDAAFCSASSTIDCCRLPIVSVESA
jgi:uncharacterized DUF497 family protein